MPGTFSSLSVHIVFSTKDRVPILSRSVREVLFPYIGGVVKGIGGVIVTVGGMPDHVHFVARLPTNVAVADAARLVKSNSSRWMNGHFRDMRFGWQRGYGAFSVSQSVIPVVVQYVRHQERHHRNRSFIDELKIMLTRHGIGFDENYLC